MCGLSFGAMSLGACVWSSLVDGIRCWAVKPLLPGLDVVEAHPGLDTSHGFGDGVSSFGLGSS